MVDHRNTRVTTVWDTILATPQEPLAGIKGARGERTLLYERLFKRKGVYVIRSPDGEIVYVGISGGGEKEGSLADRLWTHIAPSSTLRTRLQKHGLDVDQCTVAIHEENDFKKRRRAEMYGIAVSEPICNED